MRSHTRIAGTTPRGTLQRAPRGGAVVQSSTCSENVHMVDAAQGQVSAHDEPGLAAADDDDVSCVHDVVSLCRVEPGRLVRARRPSGLGDRRRLNAD